jgi:hypothetical protein
MARRDRNEAGAGHSPLVELEAELRALERKRREAIRAVDAQPVRRFEGPTRVAPGSWAELESAVYLEEAA